MDKSNTPSISHDKNFTIKIYGNPCLRVKCSPVEDFSSIRDLLSAFTQLMYDEDGVGLAAPQAGLSQRFCVIDTSHYKPIPSAFEFDGKKIELNEENYAERFPLVLINPKIEYYSEITAAEPEGCLSLPGIYAHVTRPIEVLVRYQDADGQVHTIKSDGGLARCLQHEIDHLDGILFIDRLSTRSKRRIETKLKQLKRGTAH